MNSLLHAYTVNVLNNDEINTYLSLLSASNYATPFHNMSFLKIISKIRNDLDLYFYIIKQDNRIIAIMPYFRNSYLPFTMNSLPYGCYGGFIYEENNKLTLLKYLKKNRFFKLLTTITSYQDDLYDTTYLIAKELSTWIIETTITYDGFFANLHSKTRNQIRKTYKNNIKIQDIKTADELQKVLEIYSGLIKKHSISNPYPNELFYQLFKESQEKDNIIFKIAQKDDIILAYSIFLKNEDQIFYWLNASNNEYRKFNGTNAILNNIVEYAYDNNIHVVNLGAVPLGNDGLHHFKTRWSAIEKKYNRYESIVYHKLRG